MFRIQRIRGQLEFSGMRPLDKVVPMKKCFGNLNFFVLIVASTILLGVVFDGPVTVIAQTVIRNTQKISQTRHNQQPQYWKFKHLVNDWQYLEMPISNPYINDATLSNLSEFFGNTDVQKLYEYFQEFDVKKIDISKHAIEPHQSLKNKKTVETEAFDQCDEIRNVEISELIDAIVSSVGTDRAACSNQTFAIHFDLELYGVFPKKAIAWAKDGKISHKPGSCTEWSFTLNIIDSSPFERNPILVKQAFDGRSLSSLKYPKPFIPVYPYSKDVLEAPHITFDWERIGNNQAFNLIDFPLPFLGQVTKKEDFNIFYDFEILRVKNDNHLFLIAQPRKQCGNLIKEIRVMFDLLKGVQRIEYTGISGGTMIIRLHPLADVEVRSSGMSGLGRISGMDVSQEKMLPSCGNQIVVKKMPKNKRRLLFFVPFRIDRKLL